MGRIICPLVGYKLAAIQTFRRKDPTSQAMRSYQRSVSTPQDNVPIMSQACPVDERNLQMRIPNSLTRWREAEKIADPKMRFLWLKYEGEKQYLEAQCFKRLEHSEKHYSNKSPVDILNYMPVSERIASRSLMSVASMRDSHSRPDPELYKNDSSSGDSFNSNKTINTSSSGCCSFSNSSSESGQLNLQILFDSSLSEENRGLSDIEPNDLNNLVENILADDDTRLSHISSISAPHDRSSYSSNSLRENSTDKCSSGQNSLDSWSDSLNVSSFHPSSRESFDKSCDISHSTRINQKCDYEDAPRVSFIIDQVRKTVEGPEEYSLETILSAIESTLIDILSKLNKTDVMKNGYPQNIVDTTCIVDSRKQDIIQYLVSNNYDDIVCKTEPMLLAVAVTPSLSIADFQIHRRSYWLDLNHIIHIITDRANISLQSILNMVLNVFGIGTKEECLLSGSVEETDLEDSTEESNNVAAPLEVITVENSSDDQLLIQQRNNEQDSKAIGSLNSEKSRYFLEYSRTLVEATFLQLKLVDYFYDNCEKLSKFCTADAVTKLDDIQSDFTSERKALSIYETKLDGSNRFSSSRKTTWQKPCFKYVRKVEKIMASYKNSKGYTLW